MPHALLSLLLRVERREITFPDGTTSPWEIGSYPDEVTAVAAIGFCESDCSVIMIRNYRPALGRWVLEVAGGLPSSGEDLEMAARREFEEETGYTIRHAERGPLFYSLPGVGRFPIQCFVMDIGAPSRQQLDANERIKPFRIVATTEGLTELRSEIVEPVSLCLLNHLADRRRLPRGNTSVNDR